MFCTKCGTKLDEGSLICPNCGAKMKVRTGTNQSAKTEAPAQSGQTVKLDQSAGSIQTAEQVESVQQTNGVQAAEQSNPVNQSQSVNLEKSVDSNQPAQSSQVTSDQKHPEFMYTQSMGQAYQTQNTQTQYGQSQNNQYQNNQSQYNQPQNGQYQNNQPNNGQYQNNQYQYNQSQYGQPQNAQYQNIQSQYGQPQNNQYQNPQQSYMNGYNQPSYTNPAYQNPQMQTMQGQQKKSSMGKLIAAMAACALVGLAVLIIFVLIPKGHKGYYTGTIQALGKNLDAGGFKVKCIVDGDTASATVKFDPKKSELAFLAESSDDDEKYALYNGTFMSIDEDGNVYNEGDVSRELDIFFRYYKYLDGISRLSDIDMVGFNKEILKDASDSSADAYVKALANGLSGDEEKIKELKKDLRGAEEDLDDEKFMKEYFDYQKTNSDGGTTYEITISKDNLIKLYDEAAKEGGEDYQSMSGLLSSMDDFSVILSSTTKDGYLTEVVITYNYQNNYYDDDYDEDFDDDYFSSEELDNMKSKSFKIVFSDFGDKQIDDMMEDLKAYYNNMRDPYDGPLE